MQTEVAPGPSPVLAGRVPVPALGASLRPDLDDPFFFDHPLDHVPGMLLVTGLLDLVVGAGAPAGSRLTVALWFPRFCELGEEIELRACPSAAGTWSVLATGGGEAVCLGTVGLRPGPPGPDPAAVPPRPARPVDGHLVHRQRPENILVGEVCAERDDRRRAAVLTSPRPDHLFTRRGGADRRPEELIEAARQATILRALTEYGWPADVRLSLNQLRADLPAAVPRGVPLALQWSPGPPPGVTARCKLDLVDAGADTRPLGRVVIDTQGWTEPEWRQVRARRR